MPDLKQHPLFSMAGGNKWGCFGGDFCCSHQLWMSKGESRRRGRWQKWVLLLFFICFVYENSRVANSKSCYRCSSHCCSLL